MCLPIESFSDLSCAFAAFANRVFTGKEVVLSAQVCVDHFPELCIYVELLGHSAWSHLVIPLLMESQVAGVLFLVGKIGGWFTSLGLLYTCESLLHMS